MNRVLIALCVFVLVAAAFAKPGGQRGGRGSDKQGGPGGQRGDRGSDKQGGPGGQRGDQEGQRGGQEQRGGPGGQRGGKGGHGGRGGGRKGGEELVCEVISAQMNMTKACVDGACTLGPLIKTDPEGNQVSTKFCDAVDVNGTSLVAKGACLITDQDGNVLFNRTRPDCKRPDEVDADRPVRPVVECIVEMDIMFENEAAKAFFPNGTKGGSHGRGGKGGGRRWEEDDEKDDDEDSSEEDSSDERADEGAEEFAPEALDAGQQNGRGRQGSNGRRRPQGGRGGKRN